MHKTRIVAAALAATLTLQTTTPVAAATSTIAIQNVNTVTSAQQKSTEGNAQVGGVAVEIGLILPVDYSESLGIKGKLENSNGTSYDLNFSYDSSNQNLYGSSMNCEPGEYTLTITGDGYEQFEQTIQVEANYVTKLLVKNSHELDEVYQDGSRPGVIGYGDVNGDGTIDDEDMSTMMDAIASNSSQAKFDLNKDGIVDISDASYLSYNLNETNVEASTFLLLSTDKIEKVEATGEITGDINSILSDTGVVQLKPENEEEISESNPIQIDITVNSNGLTTEGITIAPPSNLENAITDGIITVEDENSVIYEVAIGQEAADESANAKARVATLSARSAATAVIESDGTIVINLNQQVAIKKVSIIVTGTNSRNLAEIAKVEFLNDMENRIPAPSMDIPQNVVGKGGNKEFTVTWNKASNVTGYEVEITTDEGTQTLRTGTNSITVKQFLNQQIKNGTKFVVRVQSINGDWRSGYSSPIEVIPETTKVPAAPENITIEGGYKLLNISWKDMEDTDSYNLYYREKGSSDAYKEITGITKNSYQLTNLKVKTTYEIYLTGVNEIGTGAKSAVSLGETTELEYAKTSNYKLINVPEEDGTAHIKSVSYPSGKASNTLAVVDNDYGTDWILNSWQSGGFSGSLLGPIVEFDDYYKMDRFIIVESSQQTHDYMYSKVRYWDEEGKEHVISGKHTKKRDSAGKIYYEFNLDAPITTNKIQVNFSNYLAYSDGMISIAEMKFYEYDTLEEEIYALFEDDTHLSLKEGVTINDITALEERLNTPDEVSGELHFKKGILEVELNNAKAILNQEDLRAAVKIDTTVTKAKDSHLGFQSGLNAWQPLGITAHAGEQLVVYVGKDGANVGANSDVKLIATQFHAESGTWYKEVVSNLKVGKNEITIPKITSMSVEQGGALYVEYTGNNANLNISVRVSGGTDIPVLDLTKFESESDQKSAIKTYIQELTKYVAGLEEKHNSGHNGTGDTNGDYDYDIKNCIYNVTDIVLDKMMYSVAASQVLQGIVGKAGSDNIDQQVESFYQSAKAMDQMIELFYQHKGLVEYPTDATEYAAFVAKYGEKNKMPSSRLNIRYQRMFAGAFMYAGGLHIGIEWDSIPGLMTGEPVTSVDGKYESGQLFGWGIAHEIGHIINQGDYAIAEVTNNYFSILAQATESNESVRFSYDEVYKKVSSGTIGRADDVFTSLGMYWQLHLAYDNGYNYKTYDTYEDQFNNLIFARIDAYARNNSLAPKFANGKVFTLSGADTDNKLMRLAVAATQKDLLDFFRSWGMIPDETTIEYASQFEKETRKIQYITDEARDYRITNSSQAEEIANTTSGSAITATLTNETNSNQVTIQLGVNGMAADSLLGYEIIRNGETVAFVDGSTAEYVDTVTFNNKVANYSVIAYDKFLNATAEYKLDPIKIKHDGSISKDKWSVTTNMTSENDQAVPDDACGLNPIKAVSDTIDNNYSNTYTGTTTSGDAYVVLNLGEVTQIVGLKYTKAAQNAIKNYEIQVSTDGSNWTQVKTGTFSSETTQETVYFTKENSELGTSLDIKEVSYVKLIAKGQSTVSINELDLLGQPDDNVELLQNGIGILKEELVVDEANNVVIPAGSIVVTGEYSGHPAFNVVLLIDADTDEVIAGSQYIFAEDPKEGDLGAVSSGTWIYCIEPAEDGQLPTLPKNIKAELYRVDNAETLEGQRFVSDTLAVEVPEQLGDITIQSR